MCADRTKQSNSLGFQQHMKVQRLVRYQQAPVLVRQLRRGVRRRQQDKKYRQQGLRSSEERAEYDNIGFLASVSLHTQTGLYV